jgi:hypothetical protein
VFIPCVAGSIDHSRVAEKINVSKTVFRNWNQQQILNQCSINANLRPNCTKKILQDAGLYALGTSLLPSRLFSDYAHVKSEPAKIGLQLYTVRNQVKDNIADTLHKIAGIGFEAVETAFWPDTISVKQAGKYLKDAGLTVSSAHVELPIGDKKSAMLEIAETFNCKKMIWHGWPEDKRYSSLDGTKELVNIYNEANHFAKSNGLQFGLHNHWWEYRNKVMENLSTKYCSSQSSPTYFSRLILIG